MSATIATADHGIDRTTAVVSVRPVTLAAPGRGTTSRYGSRRPRRVVVAAGHSWEAQTASVLAGARVIEDGHTPGQSMADPRVKASAA